MDDRKSEYVTIEQIAQRPAPVMWDYQDIAWHIRRKVRTVRENYACRPDFPKAVRIGGTGDPLYFPEEIIEWLKKHRIG